MKYKAGPNLATEFELPLNMLNILFTYSDSGIVFKRVNALGVYHLFW